MILSLEAMTAKVWHFLFVLLPNDLDLIRTKLTEKLTIEKDYK